MAGPRHCLVVLLALCAIVAGCGSKSESAGDRQFLLAAVDASLQIGDAIGTLDQCTTAACRKRRARTAGSAVDAQIADVVDALDFADTGCVRNSGRSLIAAFRADRATVTQLGIGTGAALAETEDRATRRTAQAVEQLAACTHAPTEALASDNAVVAFTNALGQVALCRDVACLMRAGRRIERVVDEQQPIVDRSFEDAPTCERRARVPIDGAFAAARRLGSDLASTRLDAVPHEAATVQRRFGEGGRVLQGCLR